MDALKAEIAVKRKKLETDIGSRQTKYMRRGDVERIKQEEEQKAKQGAQLVQDVAKDNGKVIGNEEAKTDTSVSAQPPVVLMYTNGTAETTQVCLPHSCGRIPRSRLTNPRIIL